MRVQERSDAMGEVSRPGLRRENGIETEDLCLLPAAELAARIRTRRLSCADAVDAYLERIDQRNDATNAYVTVLADEARAAARRAEDALDDGRLFGPLHGVPVAIKDLLDLKTGVRNTFGSRPFAEYIAAETSSHVARLEGAGAIVLGKTNTPEFGHKGTTDNILFGATSTPFALDRNAGGSSGGSAAAVADGMAALAQGSDGGGSIRIPAANCGVYGFKATFGLLGDPIRPDALLGVTNMVHNGPLARTVEDAALMLSAMAGPDPRDPLSLPAQQIDWTGAVLRSVEGLRVAYAPTLGGFPVDGAVRRVVGTAVGALANAGLDVREAEPQLPAAPRELAELWVRQLGRQGVSLFEAFKAGGVDLLGDLRGELDPRVVGAVEAAYEDDPVRVAHDAFLRTAVLDALQDLLDDYDLVVSPTLAVPPVVNANDGGTVGPENVNGVEVEPLIGWCLTFPINWSGHPAASVPAGLTDDGLPVGLQLIGRRFEDATVLAASAALERVRPWYGELMALDRSIESGDG
jgi:amidase/aspartyl-tRNA(Asn)/glutamyl-tRNA(Gln) amidotransferase subunit A